MKKDYYNQIRSRWDNEARKERNIQRKYGFKPFFGFTPVLVLGLITIVSMGLACFFSWKFLIMYGITLLLMLVTFLGHSTPQDGSSSICERAKNGLLERSYLLTIFGIIIVITAFFTSEYIQNYLSIAMLIGGGIIIIALFIIRKCVINKY